MAVANEYDDDVSVSLHQVPGLFQDCCGNAILDACDIDCGPAAGPCDLPGCGQSADCDANGVPDECEPEHLDIGLFVSQLLAESLDLVLVCMFDHNGDAPLDGTDIQGSVDKLRWEVDCHVLAKWASASARPSAPRRTCFLSCVAAWATDRITLSPAPAGEAGARLCGNHLHRGPAWRAT